MLDELHGVFLISQENDFASMGIRDDGVVVDEDDDDVLRRYPSD